MAVQTVRAQQNTYASTTNGGTRDPNSVDTDISPFMDAIEERSTPFLNSVRKQGTANQRKHEWGLKAVMPRGSVVGTGGALAAATSIPLPVGHGVRFQQGHVILATRASDGAQEVFWVTEDPLPSALTARRARGGTTGLALAADDRLQIIGIAMPQNSDFPLGAITSGRRFFNYCQAFETHLTMSTQARYTPDYENPSGDWIASQMIDKGKELRQNLNDALLFSRRQAGSPDPADNDPAMMGGMFQYAELSGNVYNLANALLAIETIDTAMADLDVAVGSNAGKMLLMNLKTKQIFNRLLNPVRKTSGIGVTANSADLTWDSVQLETGTYKFTHMHGIPDGQILVYDNKNIRYMPYTNLDWKEKDVPTKGDYVWRGMSGTFTFEAVGLPGFAVLRGFNTSLAAYPAFSS